MKTKAQKRTEAKKNAELLKAKRKAERMGKSNVAMASSSAKKGKSIVPQKKKK